MVEASGKFVLVVLRREHVRVHHKKTKHEYRFSLAGDPPEVGACTFHPNPAGLVDPRDFADDASGLWPTSVTDLAVRPQRFGKATAGLASKLKTRADAPPDGASAGSSPATRG